MNGSLQSAEALCNGILERTKTDPAIIQKSDILVCPPFVHIDKVVSLLKQSGIMIGAQDCSAHEKGAYTGEVSAPMLAEIGCGYVILGHSERRTYHKESNELIAAKAKAAHKAGLVAIVCVGETQAERETGRQNEVIAAQLSASVPQGANADNTVIAYEPVWAIGTGKVAGAFDVGQMHGFIRKKLKELVEDSQKMRILYGGSMKPDNAAGLLALPDVNGGLIGGASLNADDFIAIALSSRT